LLFCAPLSHSSSCRGRHRLLLLSSALFAALCSHLCDFCDSRCPDPVIASCPRFPSSHLVHFLYTGGAGSVSSKSPIVYRFHRVPFEVQILLIVTLPTPCSVVKVFFFLLPSVSWHVNLRCRVLWLCCSPCVDCVFVASPPRMPLCARLQRSSSTF
jgi:hypothetical protein